MASTNKTPQLGLNQWAAGDEVLRTDFNGDNLAIEAGLEALKARGSCVMGSYVGNRTGNLTIELGFRPRFLVLLSDNGNDRPFTGMLFQGFGCMINSGGIAKLNAIQITLEQTGFKVTTDFNNPYSTVYYAAFY